MPVIKSIIFVDIDTHIDFYIVRRHLMKNNKITFEWVKGHSDKQPWNSIEDLIQQNLSKEEIYNIWCHKFAQSTWELGVTSFPDTSVAPQEKWAIFSSHPTRHKMIGDFDKELHSLLSFESTSKYICTRHDITDAKIEKSISHALQYFLHTLPIARRATTVKIIHGWHPTFSKLCRT
jgi:hypothetical protein